MVRVRSRRYITGIHRWSHSLRRCNGRSGDSAMDVLMRLPAAVALERLPVPTFAVARNGIILFANPAFAEMVGYEQDGLARSAVS